MAQTGSQELANPIKNDQSLTTHENIPVEENIRTSSEDARGSQKGQEYGSDQESAATSIKEIIDFTQIDPVLAKKLAIVNQGIDDIGMTSYQWKLFALNGFGYAVDSVSIV